MGHFTDCCHIQRVINVTEQFHFTNMPVFGKILSSGHVLQLYTEGVLVILGKKF